MSEIENQEFDLNNQIEEVDEVQESEQTDWKAEALKARGIAKRNATRLKKKMQVTAVTPPPAKEAPLENKTFDYAEKAYLKTSGIKSDEFDFVREVMQSTGKSLDEVLEAKYFQSELQERRQKQASKEALPDGTGRSSGSARNEVEYWLAKGELPGWDQPELRRKVVDAKIERAKNVDIFTSNPIV